MESKKPNSKRQPMFADVVVDPLVASRSDSSRENRSRYMKLMYPNGVTLILPYGIPASELMEYVNSFRS